MPSKTFFNLPSEKRQKILDLAIEEFAEHDYHRASISRLVGRAGIAKGSFYQYFENKRELFDYLLELAAEEKARFLEQGLEAESPRTVFDLLRGLLRQGLEFKVMHPGLAQIGYRAYYGPAPISAEAFRRARRAGEDFFHRLVERGQREGSIDPHLDADMVAWLLSTVFEHLGDYLIARLGIDPEQIQRRGVEAMEQAEVEGLVDRLLALLERATAHKGDANAD